MGLWLVCLCYLDHSCILAFDLLLWALIALSFDLKEPLVAIDYWYGFRLKLLIYVCLEFVLGLYIIDLFSFSRISILCMVQFVLKM